MQINPLAKLQHEISTYFDIEEIKNLCFGLNIPYDNLPATTLDGKCRELVNHCMRHNKMIDLIERLKELRGFVEWDTFELDSAKSKKTPQPLPQRLIPFSFLRQWEPMGIPNGFGADILLKSDLSQEEIISFILNLSKDFVEYSDMDEAPILIRLWSSKNAFEQNESNDFGEEFRTGYLVFYVKNLTGVGPYKNLNEIRWMQQNGIFSHLFHTTTKL